MFAFCGCGLSRGWCCFQGLSVISVCVTVVWVLGLCGFVWLWFGFWVGVDNGGFGGLLICFLGGWWVWYFLVYGWS